MRKNQLTNNIKIFDIHSHVLNNVDDGSKSIEETTDIIHELINQGVTDIVFTPHQKYASRYFKTAQELITRFEELPEYDINIYLGSEIYYTSDTAKLLEDNMLLTMNNSKVILLEFSTSVDEQIIDYVQSLHILGYKVIVAHVERYKNLTLDDLKELKNYSLLQINSQSYFDTFKHKIKLMMKQDLVDIVSSDTHNLTNRKPTIKKAYDYVMKKYGIQRANSLFYQTAYNIIFNN